MNTGESSETRAQYWQAQIEAWQASGQSQLAYCRANRLNYPRFGYWRRRLRRRCIGSCSCRKSGTPSG